MKAKLVAPFAVTALLALAACQSMPPDVAAVDSARQAFQSAQSDPRVTQYAPTELARARDTLRLTENEVADSGDSEATRHLAYLTQQRARIASEVAIQRDAEAKIKQAAAARDQARLQARTHEANAAQRQAQAANEQAQAANAQADAARARAEAERLRTAKLQAELESLHATQSDRGMVVTLQDVVFDTDSATLRSGALHTMDQLANVLRDNPERRVQIEGFTDSQGSDTYNLQLSEQRANAVRRALVERGVASDRILIRPYGEAFPIASNNSATGRQLNRRVEIIFSDPQGHIAARTVGDSTSGSVGAVSR